MLVMILDGSPLCNVQVCDVSELPPAMRHDRFEEWLRIAGAGDVYVAGREVIIRLGLVTDVNGPRGSG
jgi:mannose-6-phosphate isomerase-like protein (cupin superfamily)